MYKPTGRIPTPTVTKDEIVFNLLTLSQLPIPTEQRDALLISARLLNKIPETQWREYLESMAHDALLVYQERMSILPRE